MKYLLTGLAILLLTGCAPQYFYQANVRPDQTEFAMRECSVMFGYVNPLALPGAAQQMTGGRIPNQHEITMASPASIEACMHMRGFRTITEPEYYRWVQQNIPPNDAQAHVAPLAPR